MSTIAQLRAVGTAALQLPGAVVRRGCHGVQSRADTNSRFPVVLVHGYAGTEAVWSSARRALAEAGFGHVVSLSYNSFATDPCDVSAQLAGSALDAVAASGAAGIHLVGHSLGGLIVHRAVADTPELARLVSTAVTIASPHRGAPLARIAPGRCARIMTTAGRPPLTTPAALRRVRWLAYYSDGDRVVPTSSARLVDARFAATNVLIPGCGHLTICRDARLIRSLVGELIRTETVAQPAAAAA